MSKLTLNNVGSLIDATTAQATINSNNAAIITAFENTLSRNGAIPSQMTAPLDMNSQKVINVGAPVNNTDVARLQDLHVTTGVTIGSMALQNSNAVAITGGSITGTNLSNATINPDAYGADPTGVNPSDSAINTALAAGKQIYMTAGGTYRLTNPIRMQPNTRLNGNGATFTQSAGTNLLMFFDFQSNVASGSQLDNCIIDGNSANNTNTGTVLVNVVSANSVKILSNIVKNSTGGGIALKDSQNSTVQGNNISVCPNFGIACVATTSGYLAYAKIKDNLVTGPYFHGIQVTQASIIDISGNTFEAIDAIGDTSAPLRVNVSGTAVSWVSGPTFTSAKAGTIIVYNGGLEGVIASVNSSISITLQVAGTTSSNVLAAIGSGDVVSVTNASFIRIENNEVRGGITGGVVLANMGGSFASTDSSLAITVVGNMIHSSGQFGIACEAFTTTGSPVLNDLTISSNTIINPGRIAAAGALPLGIQLSSVTGLSTNISVTGNTLHDYSSITGGYWLGNSGSAGATNVVLSGNARSGFAMGSGANGYS